MNSLKSIYLLQFRKSSVCSYDCYDDDYNEGYDEYGEYSEGYDDYSEYYTDYGV